MVLLVERDGCVATLLILVDSLVYMREADGRRWDSSLSLVDGIYKVTGVRATLLAVGGASFTGSFSKNYRTMLDYVIKHKAGVWAYTHLLVVSMGNDTYPHLRPFIPMESFAAYARNRFQTIGLVYGGSAESWHYTRAKALNYTRRVRQVLQFLYVRSAFDFLSDGASELCFDWECIADSIGHLRVAAFSTLESAIIDWVVRVSGMRRSSL